MKFKLYREYGALNSPPVFDALQKGILSLGHHEVSQNEDVSVIWSVLWNGRMANNQKIYERNKKESRQTLILEVGTFNRGKTWKLSMDHVNQAGIFGNKMDIDVDRPKKLGIMLDAPRHQRRDEILIACQHDKSLQWANQPPLHVWVNQIITDIRGYSDRPIVVRPHPRCNLKGPIVGATIETPKKIVNSYDDFDINYNYHCVINFNSGPCIQAAMKGVPIICNKSSLAFDVSDVLENIEKIELKDRTSWIQRLTHTEWTCEELASGEPLQRILKEKVA